MINIKHLLIESRRLFLGNNKTRKEQTKYIKAVDFYIIKLLEFNVNNSISFNYSSFSKFIEFVLLLYIFNFTFNVINI